MRDGVLGVACHWHCQLVIRSGFELFTSTLDIGHIGHWQTGHVHMLGKNELEFEGGVSSRKLPNIPALALSPGSTNVTDRRSSTHRRICAISMLWVPSSSGSGPHAITGTPRPPAAPKAASSHRHTSSTHTRVRICLAVPVQRVRNIPEILEHRAAGFGIGFRSPCINRTLGLIKSCIVAPQCFEAPSVHRSSTSISIRTVHYFGTINTRRQGMLLYVVRTGYSRTTDLNERTVGYWYILDIPRDVRETGWMVPEAVCVPAITRILHRANKSITVQRWKIQ